MKVREHIVIAAIAIGFSILGGGSSTAPAATAPDSLESLVVESAKTPGQHAALADYFRAQAAVARATAARHETMRRTYAVRQFRRRDAMRGHCRALVEKYEAAAKALDALAAEHRKLAGQD